MEDITLSDDGLDYTNQFQMMKLVCKAGAEVHVLCCPAHSVGTATLQLGDDSGLVYETLPTAGVMLTADQSWVTSPTDLLRMAQYLEDCALWLAEATKDEEFLLDYHGFDDPESSEEEDSDYEEDDDDDCEQW